MGIGRFAFTPLLPMMQADAGLSLAGGGWLASVNYLGYLVGALTATALRLRAKTAIRGSLLAIALSTAAMGLVGDFAGWALLRFIAGVGSAWVIVHLSSWTLERFAALHRPALAGVVFAGVGTGIMVAGILCLALMSSGVASREAWLALGVLSLAASGLLWPVFASADAVPSGGSTRGWNPAWWRPVIAYGAYGIGYIVPATFLPAMARQLAADPAVFGWAWPVFGAAAAASTLAAMGLARDNRRLWIGAQLVLALGVAAPVAVAGLAGILVSALCVGGTFVVITMAAMGEAMRVAGAQAPRLIGLLTAAFAAGQVAGPVLISLLVEAGGRFDAGLLVASLLTAASACALVRRQSS